MRKRLTRKQKLWTFIGATAVLSLFLYWQNNDITVSHHSYVSDEVSPALCGLRIVHLSDLHNKSFGQDQTRLHAALVEEAPDLIVITGDIIDDRRYDAAPALALAELACDLAPVYYVPGNHEHDSGAYETLRRDLMAAGVQVLDPGTAVFTHEGSSIRICGVPDPIALPSVSDPDAPFSSILTEFYPDASDADLDILLSHRPELIAHYADYGPDLIFSGHAHGGQIRLPYVGGLLAPHQGFFPAYEDGMHSMGDSRMYVSRGLGNSLFPFRIFNRPEIIVVTLQQSAGAEGVSAAGQ